MGLGRQRLQINFLKYTQGSRGKQGQRGEARVTMSQQIENINRDFKNHKKEPNRNLRSEKYNNLNENVTREF